MAIACSSAAPPASADHHLMSIREVFPGGGADSSYVMLQMYSAGENMLGSHTITAYGPTGTPIVTHTFPGPDHGGAIGGGQNQSAILLADDGFAAAFPSGPTPDATDPGLNIPAGGGAVCFEVIDCVAWGNFTGTVTPAPGSPASPGGVTAGKALRRSITGGACNGQLEAADDTNISLNDFPEQDPSPRSSASAVIDTTCTVVTGPTVTIGSPKPANPTNVQSASLSFTANPSAGSTFECRLDSEGFAACTSPKTYAGPLADGPHTFQVKAKNGGETGPTETYGWTVDSVDPTVNILTKPKDPSPGGSAAFTFSASESSSFQCQLEGPKPSALAACASGKTYTALSDGSYTFKVTPTDPAGNVGTTATYAWTVDNSLLDTTPPQTTITSKPSDPSDSTSAAFTYESNEPSSTFECKLDGAAFAACPPTGISYTVAPGQHTFQVAAKDSSGNKDPEPAGYTFNVVTLGPPPVIVPPSPGPSPPPPAATPDTTITTKPPAKTKDRTPTLKFKSTVAGSTYQCKVDGKAYKTCRSPFTTSSLSFGKHTIKVKAVSGGTVDPSPASVNFKVVKPK